MVELRNALQRELGEALRLSSTVLFDYPCLEALALHLDACLFPPGQSGGFDLEIQTPSFAGTSRDTVFRAVDNEPDQPKSRVTDMLEPVIKRDDLANTFLDGVGIDVWENCRTALQVSRHSKVIRPETVWELHGMVQKRILNQTPLCVIAQDEEMAAYITSLRAEEQLWNVTC
eukprot:344158-Rhodomonas_salina.1